MNMFFDIILIFISVLFLGKVIFDIVHKRVTTLSFLYLVYFIFYIIPLILSFFYSPIFYKMSVYNLSFYDERSALYSTFINIIVVIYFIVIYKTKNLSLDIKNISYSHAVNYICVLIFLTLYISLFYILIKSPDPSVYLTYAKVIYSYDPTMREHHSLVALICRLIIFFSAINFLFVNKSKYSYLFYLISVFIVCWIGGKRSFVAYSLLVFIVSIFLASNIKPRNIFFIMVFSLIGFSGFSSVYQSNIRSFSDNNINEKIENIFLDYSRLQNERYVVYNILGSNNILPYKGASLLFNITFYIPRTYWNDKPYPYAVYYTNSLLNVDIENRLNWGLTTGLLDELLANFHWLGVLIYLYFIKKFVRANDKYLNSFSGLVGVLVSCLMIIVHFAAYSYIFILWLILYSIKIKKSRLNED